MLSKAQIERFWRDGYLVVPDAVTAAELSAVMQGAAMVG